ncbi:defensin-like [Venturia canescens]|uniref:defensin-like n=1 Tax=Venturia canescens TaxID=32260 RepID=UPI001C9C0334|nr:defensin-like [Venturia canescens]
MKIFVAVLTVAVFVACTSAAVLPELMDEELQYEMNPLEQGGIVESHHVQAPGVLAAHSRQRRFTCDAFSFSSAWVTPNHTACALKCIGKGRKGGYCENNRCICRDDKYIG